MNENQDYKIIPLSQLVTNDGQIDELPANPREITEVKMQKLKNDIVQYPEPLKYRSLLVFEHQGKYVTIGGNMRLRAMRELKMTEAPCIIIDKNTTVEQLKAYVILDNSSFGQYDWDSLLNEWETNALDAWGVDLPFSADEDIEVPSVLDKEESEKPYTVKLTFTDDAALNAFRDEYEERIKSEYEVTISVSGGKL